MLSGNAGLHGLASAASPLIVNYPVMQEDCGFCLIRKCLSGVEENCQLHEHESDGILAERRGIAILR
ncbi:unnamed protein product [Camellia sinensis]